MTAYQYTGRRLCEPDEEPDYTDEVNQRISEMTFSQLRDECSEYFWSWKWGHRKSTRPKGGFSRWLRENLAAKVERDYYAMFWDMGVY